MGEALITRRGGSYSNTNETLTVAFEPVENTLLFDGGEYNNSVYAVACIPEVDVSKFNYAFVRPIGNEFKNEFGVSRCSALIHLESQTPEFLVYEDWTLTLLNYLRMVENSILEIVYEHDNKLYIAAETMYAGAEDYIPQLYDRQYEAILM